MKLTKYWFISLFILFSCQENNVKEVYTINKTEIKNVKLDSSIINKQNSVIDTTINFDSVFIVEKEVVQKEKITIKKAKPDLEEMLEPEPDEKYKFPKEKYFRLIKSQKFYDDSVKYYSWFMRSEYWKKEYGYPDSTEYYNHYLRFWKDRVNSIKSDYDWSK